MGDYSKSGGRRDRTIQNLGQQIEGAGSVIVGGGQGSRFSGNEHRQCPLCSETKLLSEYIGPTSKMCRACARARQAAGRKKVSAS